MIYNLELEKQLLAGLIKDPESFAEISSFIGTKDFYSESSNLHRTIFTVIKQAIDSGDSVDEVIIAQRVNSLGISFEDRVIPADYIQSLALRKVPIGNLVKTARELKKYTIRREICSSSLEVVARMKNISSESSYSDIIEEADSIYNAQINLYELGEDSPENIYEEMADFIEDRGNNPITEFGMMGPYETINKIYGSLLRPGNITTLVARSSIGKTTLCMDYCTKVAARYGTPVLHFDNGEMSKEELIMRQCASLSGVPIHLLESGKWRQAGAETVAKVRSVWDKIRNIRFYYYNVGGMDVDSMIKVLKRFYYTKVGRGNQLILSFDYIKTTSESSQGKNEWQIVGEMVDKFKKTIQKDILEDGNPVVSMITSVQSNRSGITTNRNSQNVIDDESIVSLSDRIIHFSSHMFILRKKTLDEIESEGREFGTHKLINIKARHLGQDIAGALEPVQIGDSLRQNFINLDFNNFDIQDKGDLRAIKISMEARMSLEESYGDGSLPI